MIIKRTRNMDLVKNIITDSSIYKYLMPDNNISVEDFYPVDNDLFYYLLIIEKDNIAGIIFLSPLNNIMYQSHNALFPEFYGKGVEYCTKALKYIKDNTNIRKLLAFIIEDNKLAKNMLLKCGFKELPMIKNCIKINNKITNEYLMEYDLWEA
jgi:RimJ/RimL family protein N-acetyltransferase